MMKQRFEFTSNNDTLVGDLFLPTDSPAGVVVTTGPLTSVKEQAPGAYAATLANYGFAALAFDHRHFGESEGLPRQYENPEQKILDIQAGVAALQSRFMNLPVFALGVCAGGGYMASAVAQAPDIAGFAGVAGFYHDVAQSREWMGQRFDETVAQGRAARDAYEATGEVAMMPAVAKDGERAMPLDEAYAYYGTERGGEARYENYINAYAIMSQEPVTRFDAQQRASAITVPTLLVHSVNALSPMLAERLYDNLGGEKSFEWVNSQGQIDFYDDKQLIDVVTQSVARSFRAVSER